MPEWWEPRAQAWRKQFQNRVSGAKTQKLEKWLDGARRGLEAYEAEGARHDREADTGLTLLDRLREEIGMVEAELGRRP